MACATNVLSSFHARQPSMPRQTVELWITRVHFWCNDTNICVIILVSVRNWGAVNIYRRQSARHESDAFGMGRRDESVSSTAFPHWGHTCLLDLVHCRID